MRNKIESGRLNAASYIVFRGLRISDHDDSKRFSHCNKQHMKKDNTSIPVDSNIIPPRAPDNCVVHFLNFSAVFKYRHLGAYSRFARHNRNEPPDLIIGRFFFVGFTVFAFVRVLLDGSQRLKRLDASFLLARIFRCLVLSVTDWV